MQERRVKLATTKCKTHWSNVDTRSYTALDFTLHDSHMLITIIFMRPLGRVGIYCVLLYNLYSGVWVTYVLYKKVCSTRLCGARSGSPQLWLI